MQAREIKSVVKYAEANHDLSAWETQSLVTFAGSAYWKSNVRVFVPIQACAYVLRYQAKQMNGTWDVPAMNEMIGIFKRHVTLV